MRSAGSKGKIDLMALKSQKLLFVQCKLNGLCTPAERKEIIRLSLMVNAVPLVAYSDKGVCFRKLNGPGPYDWVNWDPQEK